ncbi:hypothetical protein T12_11566 [Trichinella patagoniensis]|uniref:Uncharacterized protein n=1 Tax=Trichinella patagoniensis TaxID=990121 RepID=A0A0V0ZNZ0_9BILA|nr:hypothetical protein T12_11566 [Trichinella patagoniensis]
MDQRPAMTERHAERWLVKYRFVGSRESVTRSQPRFSPAASLNWAGGKDLLPRFGVCLSWTCN